MRDVTRAGLSHESKCQAHALQAKVLQALQLVQLAIGQFRTLHAVNGSGR